MDHSKGWIGVDLDGTLAEYTEWKGIEHIGAPIWPMVERIHKWIELGYEVRIFTARVSGKTWNDEIDAHKAIRRWLIAHLGELGESLTITNVKDFAMVELWDDRAIQVRLNEGHPVLGSTTRTGV